MINILISTIDDRINNVKNVLLEPRDDVEYLISHQYTDVCYKKIPPELLRSDVAISQIEGRGVTRSRNNAIKLARGEIGLISDDDVSYNDEYIDTIEKTFSQNPDIDVALFQIKTPENEPQYKTYKGYKGKISKLAYSVSSIEIAFNIQRIRESGILFDERFGMGAELFVGIEENIFVEDCIKAGLNVFVIPEYIVEHPYLSTSKSTDPFHKSRIQGVGAYDCRTNGSISILKAFGGTIKMLPILIRNKINPLYYLYHRLLAVFYILRTNKKKTD